MRRERLFGDNWQNAKQKPSRVKPGPGLGFGLAKTHTFNKQIKFHRFSFSQVRYSDSLNYCFYNLYCTLILSTLFFWLLYVWLIVIYDLIIPYAICLVVWVGQYLWFWARLIQESTESFEFFSSCIIVIKLIYTYLNTFSLIKVCPFRLNP